MALAFFRIYKKDRYRFTFNTILDILQIHSREKKVLGNQSAANRIGRWPLRDTHTHTHTHVRRYTYRHKIGRIREVYVGW